jgi:hypothetical protein
MNQRVLHNLDNIITALESRRIPNMRADNSIHLTTAARQRYDYTRAKAIAAMHELHRARAMPSFKSVARHSNTRSRA